MSIAPVRIFQNTPSEIFPGGEALASTSNLIQSSGTVVPPEPPTPPVVNFDGSIGWNWTDAPESVSTGVGLYDDIYVPVDFTITGMHLDSPVFPGSAILDIYVCSNADYPAFSDSICGYAPPTLASESHTHDDTLYGWTVDIFAGQHLRAQVISASVLTQLNLMLTTTRALAIS